MSHKSSCRFPPFFRVLLYVFPKTFRRKFAAELIATVAERRQDVRQANVWVVFKFWVREGVALVREGCRVRFGGGAGKRRNAEKRHDAQRSLGNGIVLGLMVDIRYSIRKLAAAPGFTIAAVLVLAFGIGANGTVFSALKMAILAEPPYPESERLVIPSLDRHDRDISRVVSSWSYPKYRLFEDHPDRILDPIAAYTVSQMTLSGVGDPIQIDVELVTPDYFPLLGVSTVVGRTFAKEEDDEQAPPMLAVLGYGLWQDRFGSDPNIVGRRIQIEARWFTVIGVAPRGFSGVTGRGELWLPLATSGTLLLQMRVESPEWNWFHVLGRVQPGFSLDEARAQMSLVGTAVAEAFPDRDGGNVKYDGSVRALRSVAVNRTARLAILVLSGAAATVLLIACANLAGLLLARAGARKRETAVRLAVGAGRWRIVRQLLVESLVLAFVGGGAGLILAHWGILGLRGMGPESLISGSARLQYLNVSGLRVDSGVLLFTIGLSVLTSVLFGLVPALRLSRLDLLPSIKSGSEVPEAKHGGRSIDVRGILVGAQIALAMVLLAGAGLLIGSLAKLQGVETGIDSENLLTFTYNLPRTPSSTDNAGGSFDQAEFHAEYLTRLRSLPGVRHVSLGCPPLGGTCIDTGLREIAGSPPIPREERIQVGADAIAEGLFQTVGTPLVRGRDFAPSDREGTPLVVIVNELAAQRIFPGQEALGQRIAIGFTPEGQTAEIVGVVGNVRYEAAEPREEPMVYVPLRQMSGPLKDLLLSSVSVLVRTEGDPNSLLPAMRRQLSELNSNIPLYSVSTVEALGARAVGNNRTIMGLLSLFAAVAVTLSAIGIYGVVAYAASLHNREIGLRMALGAQSTQVLGLVLRRGVVTSVAGLSVGLCCAWGITRVLANLLFEISPTDPVTFALGAGILFVTAVLASYLPARRATRVDPMDVLRVD